MPPAGWAPTGRHSAAPASAQINARRLTPRERPDPGASRTPLIGVRGRHDGGRVVLRLSLKTAYGHIAVVHADDVATVPILGNVQVPMGLTGQNAPQGYRPGAVAIESVGALQLLAPDLTTAA